MPIIYIRCEIVTNELRTPIVPADIPKLRSSGFTVYVQSSDNRIYSDITYAQAGAIITKETWYNERFNGALIVGLKTLDHLEKLNNHTHVYFSHSFKGQQGSDAILSSFKQSNSKLYDHEFFMDADKRRLTAFGYHAGVTGAAVGLLHHFGGKTHIQPWLCNSDLLRDLQYIPVSGKIAIIGDGRCAQGVKSILEELKMAYVTINKGDDMKVLLDYDIIYNCILLDPQYNTTWFDESTRFSKRMTIVDISCDYNKPNNPIKLYSAATSWAKPAFKYNDLVDVVAIENLPALLPKTSSDRFYLAFTDLLLDYTEDTRGIWKDTLGCFYYNGGL